MTPAPAFAGDTVGHRPALVVLCFAQFMLVLDDTVVNVALPSIREDLGFSTVGLTWVANAYFLSFGGLLLFFGRMGDRVGHRSLFLSGVAVFGAASLLCGLAQEPWQLVAGRFVQGTGAAMASPAALALITLLYPEAEERAKALGVWGGVAALGGTTGLVISGALTGLASWRWIFMINLPVALVVLLLIPRLVSRTRVRRAARLDVPGAVLGTGAVVSLVYGLIQAEHAGWGQLAAFGPLCVSGGLAVSFVVVEARTASPLLPMSFLTIRVRAVANGASLLFAAAFFALSFLLMLHLQTGLGFSPLKAGLAYLPYGGGILTGVWLSTRAVARLGLRWSLVLSFLISSVGLVLLSGVSPDDGYAAGVLPGMLVASLGSGLGFPALAIAGVTGTSENDAGLGSALLSSVQQIGGAAGLALLATLAVHPTDVSAASEGQEHSAIEGISSAFAAAAGLLALGAVLVAVLLRSNRRPVPVRAVAGGAASRPPHRQ